MWWPRPSLALLASWRGSPLTREASAGRKDSLAVGWMRAARQLPPDGGRGLVGLR